MNRKNALLKCVVIVLCSLAFALNINSFIHAGNLLPGGFAGVALFIQRVAAQYYQVVIPYSLLYYILNAIPVYIGYKWVSKKFTLYSCGVILLTGIFVELFPNIIITSDILLISIFGGIINGFITAIALNFDTSSGGTDFIALSLSSKRNVSAFSYILACNVIILFIYGLLFTWEQALYSIIFQYCSTVVINKLYVRYEKATLFIISDHPQIIIQDLLAFNKHGITKFQGVGTYTNTPRTLLYTVINYDEVKTVIKKRKKH